jgi:HTH-type transcriptional regulator/antitoxin HigA
MEIQPIKNALSHAAALAEIEAIRFRMDQSGLVAKDLVPSIGPINRVYEVLAHKRPLTLNMIRRLTKGLGIPADILISQHQEDVETA